MILPLLLSSYLWAKNSEEVKIPPPENKPKPVAKIPNSFTESSVVHTQKLLEIERAPKAQLRSLIYVTNLVMEETPNVVGEVVVTDTATNTVGPFQHVLIRSDKVTSGQTYTVIKDVGQLKLDSDVVHMDKAPRSIQIQGEVKILNAVRVPKLQETLWRAEVVKSYHPLEVGGKLSEIKVAKVDLTQKGVPARIEGEIIGGAMDLKRRLLEPGATVFIGSEMLDSFRVGQLIEVYSTQSLYSVRSALIRVAYVDQEFATAVIVTSDREVQPGDRLSRPD